MTLYVYAIIQVQCKKTFFLNLSAKKEIQCNIFYIWCKNNNLFTEIIMYQKFDFWSFVPSETIETNMQNCRTDFYKKQKF